MRAARAGWPAFSQTFAASAALVLALGVAVTLTIDPFWVFRDNPPWLAWTGGANRHLDLEMRRAKPLQVHGRPAETVLLGSSTVYRGLDPGDLADGGYNFGLSSLMADELPVAAAIVAGGPERRHVVIGLDYFMFSSMAGPPRLDPALASRSGLAAARLSAAISLRALTGSMPSAIRNAPEPGVWRRDGFKQTPDYPAAVTTRIAAEQTFPAMAYRPETVDHLATALSILRGLDVRLYLSPVSGAQLALARAAGREPEIERWRADVKRLASRLGVTLQDLSRGHPFDDFDPARGSSAYWLDSLHFKPVVGRWILDRLGLPTRAAAARRSMFSPRTRPSCGDREDLIRAAQPSSARPRLLRG